ncbi:glycoside hydrolase family 18 protein [Sparassis crispa]|uniref:Glycoside hydrolase family 18 protein n=1 Tax=Sparassis crispa TaxID=139825 RepID=A0A401GDH5_9APHY|nr:glycoside hydrolase family 18 protein [Sparassis crispa]GBE80217.1 glycoside hydrolase family 18 protein [Sparassis crispa]
MTVISASIVKHTTASSPRPHVLYCVKVTTDDGQKFEVAKRYSEFVDVHSALADSEVLPPKRIMVTSFIPSAWVDDKLIAERKEGLNSYLTTILGLPEYREHAALVRLLTPVSSAPAKFDPEDALPSTLSRKTALELQGKLSAAATTPIAAAYYPDWASATNPPQGVDFSKFDVLLFAFATPNSSSTISYDSGSTSTLETLVSSAHNSGYGTKVVLSIGGWGGSYYFSQAVGTSANMTTFVNACVSAVNTYDLDGIDIDWEYPGESGAGNPYSSDDSANFLAFLTSLRSALGWSKIISAAVTDLPWQGSNGSPLTNVAAYAAQLTYANIMNYDVWGASSTPGPNAPLGNLCGTAQLPQYSAEAALSQWTTAGFPASQLVLGLPLYGYVSESTATTLAEIALPPPGFRLAEYRQRVLGLPMRNPLSNGGLVCELPQRAANKPSGKPNPLNGAHPHARSKVVTENANLSSYWGQQIAFNQIVALGALTETSWKTFQEAGGYTEGWDNCSDTPYLFDVSQATVVTYDDTYSLGDKATFAKQNGMAGCFTWSLDQDYNYVLQDVIRSSLGLS